MFIHLFSYRSRDEIQEVRQKRDPINGFKDKIIEAGLATAQEIKVSYLPGLANKVRCLIKY